MKQQFTQQLLDMMKQHFQKKKKKTTAMLLPSPSLLHQNENKR
jgi:hypothetical protein